MPAPLGVITPPRRTPSRRAGFILGFALAALLAACSSAEEEDGTEQAAAIAPAPELTGNPVMTRAPDGGAMTPGAWEIGEDALNAFARFGTPGSEPLFAMECDVATQTLSLTRAGEAGAQGADTGERTYILEAGGQQASVDLAPGGGVLPLLTGQINPAMPIFQAFQPLANVITVTGPDGAVLRMQGAPGIGRVIEACSRT